MERSHGHCGRFRNGDGEFRPGQEWELEVADDQRKPLYMIRISAQEMK